ncbi:MAG TPA: BON domain-containing protein [Pyrinomonadaceae bacterium]
MSKFSDSEIEQRVLKELSLSDAIASREICVVCRHSVVTLRGTVHSFENKSAATQATKMVNGVVGVVNQIRVERSNGYIRPRIVFQHSLRRMAASSRKV